MRAHRYAILALVAWARLCLWGSFTLAQDTPGNRERTLLFVGDIMLARGVQATMKARGDWTYPFQKIARTLSAADLTFGNLECPISDMGRDLRHLYSFRADPKVIEGLSWAGFRVVSVANNHVDDWDRPALLDTLRRLREAGIQPVGAGRNDVEAHSPVVVDLAGVKLAFLAYVNIEPRDATAEVDQPGVAWLDPERALADIRSSRSLADLVVVSLHWGVEYSTRPGPRQVKLAHQMVEAGADLVVGHHSHAVQPVEKYGEGWIAYSLGNFIFDQRDPATRHGIILKVTLREKRIAGVVPIPITVERGFRAVITQEPPARTSPATPK